MRLPDAITHLLPFFMSSGDARLGDEEPVHALSHGQFSKP
jgi:hypothetical protein